MIVFYASGYTKGKQLPIFIFSLNGDQLIEENNLLPLEQKLFFFFFF